MRGSADAAGGTRWRSTRGAIAARDRTAGGAARTISGARARASTTRANGSMVDGSTTANARGRTLIAIARTSRKAGGGRRAAGEPDDMTGSVASNGPLPLVAPSRTWRHHRTLHQSPRALGPQPTRSRLRSPSSSQHHVMGPVIAYLLQDVVIYFSIADPRSAVHRAETPGHFRILPLALRAPAPRLRSPWYRVCRGWWRRLHTDGAGELTPLVGRNIIEHDPQEDAIS